jgi:hypothetical protein
MSTQPTPAPAELTHTNPAVARCLYEYTSTYKAHLAINQTRFESREWASVAYREAVPPLCSVRYPPGSKCQLCARSVPAGYPPTPLCEVLIPS